jgi:8-oxo-dGTP pyrophosphatase MutT (NUDIX family)
VLLRDVDASLEVLLLRRNRRAGFVPGMYVFPGGRVDASDADPAALSRLDDLTPDAAANRLDLRDAIPPAIAYYLAAVREAFEETGILVGSLEDGSAPPTAAADPAVDRVRDQLMESRIKFADALARMQCRMAGAALHYFAHWITPLREPRRFDTRFFAARVEAGATPIVDPREMTDARWLAPAQALEEHFRGHLPMILPTVQTLQRLSTFSAVADALDAFAIESVVTILPDQ